MNPNTTSPAPGNDHIRNDCPGITDREHEAFLCAIRDPETRAKIREILQRAGLLS